MSEELRQKGYLDSRGNAHGIAVGPYEGFNLGATTLDQLRRARIIPDLNYGRFSTRKPDGIVVDRRTDQPLVKLVIEFKDRGKLDSEIKTNDVSNIVFASSENRVNSISLCWRQAAAL